MSVLLQTIQLTKQFGEYEALKDISLTIEEGEKIGFVGLNGAGKSTLMEILAGEMEASSGRVIWHQSKRISYLRQTAAENEALGSLSGGEKTKRLFNECLEQHPGVLILDEPTNHLDTKGIDWLIQKIQKFKGTVLIISHDRYFLDQCVERIEEIEKGKNETYLGNYSWYREEKKRRFDAAQKAYAQQEKNKKAINEAINQLKNWSDKAHQDARKKARATGNLFGGKEHNRVKAKKMDKRIHSQLKRLEKIEVEGVKAPEAEKRVYFRLEKEKQKGQRIICAEELGMTLGKKVLFKESNFYVLRGEHIGIVGPNGCGKSTLLHILLGRQEAEGELFFSHSRKIGYMSQEIMEWRSHETIQESFGTLSKEQEKWVRNQLASLGFSKRMYHQQIESLSMGERMKLKLLKMILDGCELLVLDEPTNHMDLMMREQLEEVLASYEGTLLLVSHDRYLIEKVCQRLLVFENHRIQRFEGRLSEYEAKQKAKQEQTKQEKSNKSREAIRQKQEEHLRREFRMHYLIGKLSTLPKQDKQYAVYEAEYEKLLEENKF